MIEVEHLTKRYGSHTAVDDISFTVEDGGIYGLLGPNGAGKSTTMNIITGYISATDGTVKIDGHDIADEPAAAKACIGYLPELPPLYQEMTVQEYLLFVAELKGTRKKADRAAAVEHAAARAGLQGMEQRLIRNLSKGYRQRVGIAAALLGTPKIIILDEPTVGLDPAQMIEIRSLIRDLGKTHTVILSSHILSEVQTVCDRVLIIAHGRLVAQGTPEELAAQLTAKGTITATAQGSREAVVAAAGKVPGLTDLRVTDEKGGEVSFTAVSTAGTDLRGALSLALAQHVQPVGLQRHGKGQRVLRGLLLQNTAKFPQLPQQVDGLRHTGAVQQRRRGGIRRLVPQPPQADQLRLQFLEQRHQLGAFCRVYRVLQAVLQYLKGVLHAVKRAPEPPAQSPAQGQQCCILVPSVHGKRLLS